MKLISMMVLLVLTVLGARSCSGSTSSSPDNPDVLLRNGIAGVCANGQAVADASGSTGDSGAGTSGPPSTLMSAQQAAELKMADPAEYASLFPGGAGAPTCPTG
jgi:hypothetical protein